MKQMLQITIIGIALALAGSGSAHAQPAHHASHSRRPSRLTSRYRARRHGWIIGNRRTHVYSLYQASNRLPARQNRVYFGTTTAARAAGYQPAPRNAIPVKPRLTWKDTRHLPSIGTQHVPPPPPKDMRKPLAPPADQQPLTTPTQPMPN